LAGFGDTTGVIVREDDGGGVVPEDSFQDFARKNRGAIDGAAEEIFAGDEFVAFGQEDNAEDFVLEGAESHSQ